MRATELRTMIEREGWVEQDIPGLWRHPEKAYGDELTLGQVLDLERSRSPRMHDMLAPFVPPPAYD